MRPALRTALAVAAVLSGACSLLVGSDSVQCTTSADCRSRGGAFASTTCASHVCVAAEPAGDGASDSAADVASDAVDAAEASTDPWACIGKVTAPAEDRTRSVTLTYQVTDIGNKPIPGMLVTACNRTDPSCAMPLFPALPTDAQGMVSFQVPYAARVFVKVTEGACDGSSCYLPSLYYVDPPPTSAPALFVIESLTPAAVTELLTFAGAPDPYDPKEGIVILLVQDCRFLSGFPQPGIHFSLSSTAGGDASAGDTESFYLVNMSPVYSATETSSDGVGGFVNAPPGLTTITGTLVQSNTKIGQNPVYVQASTVTYATIDPYEN